jgi:heme oxygenase
MSLLLLLRERTRQAHARLEDGVDVLERCRDRHAYADLLACLRSVYAPLERALDASPATPPLLPDWSTRRKTGWLDEDLAALGFPAPEDAEIVLPQSAEDVAGAAYVMEGATLGGAVVLRRIEQVWFEPLPHRFFASYGAQRARRWRDLRQRMEAAELDAEATADAAERTFEAFHTACLAGAR